MKKVVDFLEQYVQWVALGIGGLVLLAMAYVYFTGPAATVDVASQQLGPGAVEEQTLQGPVQTLKTQMSATPDKAVHAPDVLKTFTSRINDNAEIASLPSTIFRGPLVGSSTGPARGQEQIFAMLPDLAGAAPKILDVSKGLSRVIEPEKPAAEGAANQLVAQNKGAADEPAALPQKDITWASVGATISGDELKKAFLAAFNNAEVLKKVDPERKDQIAAVAFTSMIINLQVERQEKLPNGQWGEAKVIPPAITTEGPARPAFPGAQGPDRESQTYLTWAIQHPADVFQPAFFETTEGDSWYRPGTDAPTADSRSSNGTFDPAAPNAKAKTAEEKKILAEYRKQLKEQKRAEAANRAAARAVPAGGGGYGAMGRGGMGGGYGAYGAMGRGGMGGGYGAYGAMGGGYGAYGAMGRGGGYGAYGGGYGAYGGGYGAYGAMGRGGYGMPMPGVGTAAITPGTIGPDNNVVGLQSDGTLDLTTLTGNINVWAHDLTVAPGKTYRYRVSYALRNPLYKQIRYAPDALTQVFALMGPQSEWSEPITIQPKTEFFVTNIVNKSTVTIDLFTSKPGEVAKSTLKVAAGDPVGDTGWTVVDAREDVATKDQYLLLVDSFGRVTRRDLSADRRSPRYKELQSTASTGGSINVASR